MSPTEKIMLSSYPLLGFWKQGYSVIRAIAGGYSANAEKGYSTNADPPQKTGYSANRGIARMLIQNKGFSYF